jgi:predicted nucleic-acid-binding Zn-ribbon protein
MSKNENCLRGMRCPKCGNEDVFNVLGSACFEVTDAGAERSSDIEWDEHSACTCGECDHTATWGYFQE